MIRLLTISTKLMNPLFENFAERWAFDEIGMPIDRFIFESIDPHDTGFTEFQWYRMPMNNRSGWNPFAIEWMDISNDVLFSYDTPWTQVLLRWAP